MYVTPVRQKWANQVTELAGKKEVKAGLLHIDFVPSEYNHKVHFTEVNKKRVSAFLGRKIHMARWNLNWQLLSPLLQAYIT